MERCIENLYIWNESRKAVNMIYAIMQNCRDYGFRDQIQRASVSIMNNIAEGFESGTDKMFVRYLSISKASCSEVKSMLYLCEDRKYCTLEKRKELHSKLLSITSQIYKLIEYLNKSTTAAARL